VKVNKIKLLEVLYMEERLNGFESEYIGVVKNPVTEKQTKILNKIREKFGDSFVPLLTNSLQAWNFIKMFENYIEKVDNTWIINDLDVSNVVQFTVIDNEIFTEVVDFSEDILKPIQVELDFDDDDYWDFDDPSNPYDYYSPGDDFEEDWIRSLE
jgi:hypothetical protein